MKPAPWGFSVASVNRLDGLCINDRSRPLVRHFTPAFRWHQRLIGLLGRRQLPDDEALWLRPCGSVHTFGMRFAIDVLFLDADDTVVHVEHGLTPWRVARASAVSVVELAAGVARRNGIDVGDAICVNALATSPEPGESLA